MKNKKVKEFLVREYSKKWLSENKELMEDYTEICENIILFHANWGINIGLILKKPEEVKGRELGVGIVEELFIKP